MASWNDLRRFTSVSVRLSERSYPVRAALIGSMVVCLVTPLTPVTQPEILDRILAVVAGNVVMLSDVRAFIDLELVEAGGEAEQEEVVLEHLIERRLILDEVNRYGVADPSAAAVERQLATVRDRFTSTEAFATALDLLGLTEADLRQILRDDLRRGVYLEDRFAVSERFTEAELRDYFEEHRAEFTRDGRPLSFIEAGSEILKRLGERLRAKVVAEWTARLVGRAEVLRVPATPTSS